MKFEWNNKYTIIAIYTVITFAVCLVLVFLAINSATILSFINTGTKALSSIWWGIVIAYLLNPVMVKTEKLCKKVIEKKTSHPIVCRGLSTAAALIFGLSIICALVAVIVPQLLDSLVSIFDNIPTYLASFKEWVTNTLNDYPELIEYINPKFETTQAALTTSVNEVILKAGDWIVKIKDGAINIIIAFKDFIIGFIVAAYLLFDKEKFLAAIRKTITAIFPKTVKDKIFKIAYRTNNSLSGFVSGKLIDSFIIGVLCFIAMTIMKIKYPLLISVIIGITNVIPVFGPFIGAIPSGLLILIIDPSKTILFIVFIIILQQIDGNIIGPYILGDTTGLPPFWVMFAIFLGGGLFGIVGMLLGVPIFAVVYTLINEIIEYRLELKGLPTQIESYGYSKPKKKKTFHKKNQNKNE